MFSKRMQIVKSYTQHFWIFDSWEFGGELALLMSYAPVGIKEIKKKKKRFKYRYLFVNLRFNWVITIAL